MNTINQNKVAIVTGGGSGIGLAIAEKFTQNKITTVIVGRDEDKLIKAKTQLGEYCHHLICDVSDLATIPLLIEKVLTDFGQIDILVNNAGLALGRDSFENANLDDWDTMIDTNLKGMMYVTKAVLPYMTLRKKGHIINMGSVAGKEVYKDGNGYCASKYAVDALSKSMRIDLLAHKIKVTAIHPGAAETEFAIVRFKGDESKAKQVYEGYTPLSADDIAGIAFYCATLPEHVCINDLVVTCTAQADAIYFHK